MDFIDRLYEAVETLNLEFPLKIGVLDEAESVSIHAMGGQTIKSYYDGVKTKQLNYEFSIKTRKQEQAFKTLNAIANHLSDVEDIPSENDSYTFEQVRITDEAFLVRQDDKGHLFYCFAIQVRLTIFNKER